MTNLSDELFIESTPFTRSQHDKPQYHSSEELLWNAASAYYIRGGLKVQRKDRLLITTLMELAAIAAAASVGGRFS